MNVLEIPIPDLATLDRALEGELRRALDVVVGMRLAPTLDVERADGQPFASWVLVIGGMDREHRHHPHVRLPIPFGEHYDDVVLATVKLYIRGHVRTVYEDLIERFRADVVDANDALAAVRLRSLRPGGLS